MVSKCVAVTLPDGMGNEDARQDERGDDQDDGDSED